MELEGSSPQSQAPANCPYPEPAQSSPHNKLPLFIYTKEKKPIFSTCTKEYGANINIIYQ
jgi:hypothetical protein